MRAFGVWRFAFGVRLQKNLPYAGALAGIF